MEQRNPDLEEILILLAQAHSSETIKNAVHILNTQFYVSPECIPALIQSMTQSPHVSVRQLAAVELRKKISKWWCKLPEFHKENQRSKLLSCIVNEKNNTVWHSMARVVSAIALIDLPEQKWPRLRQFVNECCTNQNVAYREVGAYCIYTLFEVVADDFMDDNPSLFGLLCQLIKDAQSITVRVTIVLALGKLAEHVQVRDESLMKMLTDNVPHMAHVLDQCIKKEDNENINKIIEVFNTLLMLDMPILNNHLAQLLDYFLTLGANTNLDDTVRVQALTFLMWAAIYKHKKIKQLKILNQMLERLMPIGTEEDPDDPDEDTPSSLTFKVIHALVTSLPPHHVFPIILPWILNYRSSPDITQRKASLLTLATTVEGCPDQIASHLPDLFPFLFEGLQTEATQAAACTLLGQLADHFPYELSQEHVQLMPLILSGMADPALVTVLDGLSGTDTLLGYLPHLMDRLLSGNDLMLEAIGSAAAATGQNFQPYFETALKRVVQGLGGPESALVLETVGSLAEAVGAEMFKPYLDPIMRWVLEHGLGTTTRLREASLLLSIHLVRVFRETFGPYLLLDEWIGSCGSDELEERRLGAECIGEVAVQAPVCLTPCLDRVVAALESLTTGVFEHLRRVGNEALLKVVRAHPALADLVLPSLVGLWVEEDDLVTSAAVAQALAVTFRDQPSAIRELPEIGQHLIDLFQKSAICWDVFDDEDEGEEDEMGLIQAGCELISSLVETLGRLDEFDSLLPLLLDYPDSEHTLACLASCAPLIVHPEPVLEVFYEACQDPQESMRRNAAYGLGVLCLKSPGDLERHYGRVLHALSPLFGQERVVVDNAAGALARMILARPHAVPLPQVLPTLLQALPLKDDFLENQPVFDCLFQLFQANHPFVLNHARQFLHVFELVLSDHEQLDETTRLHLIELIRHLNRQSPDLHIGSTGLAMYL